MTEILWPSQGCDPAGHGAAMSLSSPSLLLMGLTRVCWQVSSPSRFRSCSGTDLSWETRAFPNQRLRKAPLLVGSEKKERLQSHLCLQQWECWHCFLWFLHFTLLWFVFSSYSVFFIMPKHFLFPIGLEDARGWHWDHMLTTELLPPPSWFF